MGNRNKFFKFLVALLALIGLATNTNKAFADNEYGIYYSGGEPFSAENVTVNESLTSLVPLYVKDDTEQVTVSGDKWVKDQYVSSNGICNKFHFIQFRTNNRITDNDDVYFKLATDKYDVKVQIKRLTIDGGPGGRYYTVGVTKAGTILAGYGRTIYTDSQCTNKYTYNTAGDEIESLKISDDTRIFVETNIKLYKHGTDELFTANELYFGLMDIDLAQSFKIKNSGALLTSDSMLASSDIVFEPDNGLYNRFVADGNYIYSEYRANGDDISRERVDNIYVIPDLASQEEGLNVVYGFAKAAGTLVEYYVNELHVEYESDNNGTITGITEEGVISGKNPTGSESTPTAGFVLDYWTADKDVTLTDDTVITAGSPLTPEQIEQVVVIEDLVFTAIHHDTRLNVYYESDQNGEITGIASEKVIPNNNPSGSESTPEIGFVLDHWVADKDVALANNTIITAGDPMTPEQVEQVVVVEDLVFTAIHRDTKLDVTYASDEHGMIAGITSERVLPNANPYGSTTEPNYGFVLDHWVADKDVALANNTIITAGDPLTPEQVKQVVVTEDLAFTAIHRDIRLDIAYASDEHGTITGITSEKVVPNDNPSGSESTPERGFGLDHWVADKNVTLNDGNGTVITAGGALTSEQVEQVIVTENLIFTAIHRDIKLDVTYTSDAHGTITGIASERVVPEESPSGSESTPERGYAFDHWVADKNVSLTNGGYITAGGSLTTEQVTMVIVTEDLVFTAIHNDAKLDVRYTSDNNGTIIGITSEKVIPSDNPSGSESTPDEGYAFDHWVADKDVTLTGANTITAGEPLTPEQVAQVVVTENLVFTAIHRDIRLDVTYVSDEYGTITGIISEKVIVNYYPSGSQSAPVDGFTFSHWIVDKTVMLANGVIVNAGNQLTSEEVTNVIVTENLVFTAIHRDGRLGVVYASDEHGTITGITNERVNPNNSPSGSESTPAEGYVFDHWVADKNVTLNSSSVTVIYAGESLTPEQVEQVIVTEDLVFTAIHRDTRLDVTYASDEHGTITGITSEKVVPNANPSGSEETPERGYELDRWTADKDVTLTNGDTITAGDPLTPEQIEQVVVTEDLVFTAIHRDARLDVTYTSDEHGTITGITSEKVIPSDNPSGSESTPDEGYAFDHWVADKDVTLTGANTITAGEPLTPEQVAQVVVTENLVFTAIHRDIKLDVAYASDEHGEITGITSERIVPNDNPSGSQSTPERGYTLDHWEADKDVTLEDGTTITAGSPITPEQILQVVVTENLTFTAVHRDTKLDVAYASDEHGEITGKTSEKVIPNDNPTGSESTPVEGYAFDHWVADKDVTIAATSATVITAGNPITPEQVEQVIITENLTFTAIHRDVRLDVAYESDEHGTITGIAEEKVVPNGNPSGTEETPERGYELDHWTADKNVVLEDGTEITAGEPIAPEQIAQIVVTEDITFTAVHRDERLDVAYRSDEHGEITGKTSEIVLPNGNPTGSESTPEQGYELDHWTADKNVVLEDGTEIAARAPIALEQITQVVVSEDLVFTAIHRDVRLDVAYESDEHGAITGITEEKVVSNGNPSGTEITSEQGYELDHWTADKNVVLEDGTEIAAGDPITSEQIEQVVVTEDITFTAIHRDERLDITYTSDEYGAITGKTSEIVLPNGNPTGSSTQPNLGYALDHWEADKDVTLTTGDTINAGDALTAEQVEQVVATEDLVFTAIHRDIRLDVTYESDEHGEITGITEEKVVPDDNPTGTEEAPEEGYTLDHWEADKDVILEDGTEITAGNPIAPEQVSQIVITENVVLTAVHIDVRKTITYESDEHGEITGITSERVIPNNNPSGTEENPEAGFALDHWEADKNVTLTNGNTIAAGNPLTPAQIEQVVVTEDITFTAIHRDTKLDITYVSDEHGTVTGITEEKVLPNGNPTGTEETPEEGYAFDHWEANVDVVLEDDTEIPAGSPITPAQIEQVVVTEDITFTAIHRDTKLDITYVSDEHGTVTGITEEKVLPNGNPTGTEETPEEGFALDHWEADVDVILEDGTEITAGNPITPEQISQIVVTEDITLTAVHKDIRKKITYESDENGEITGIEEETVSPNDNPAGSEEEPKEYYVFDHWEADVDVILEDGTEITAGNPITPEQISQIVVTEDITLTAIHRDIRKKITYVSDENGEITGIEEEPVVPEGNPSGSEEEPKEDYEFDHWEADVDVVLEDGTEIPAGDPISPEQIQQIVVTEDVTLTAVHKKIVTPEPEPEPEPEAPEVPNTGTIADDGLSATEIIISVASIIVAATLAKVAHAVIKKRIGYKNN